MDDTFGSVSGYKVSGRKLHDLLLQAKSEDYKAIIKEYTDIDITDQEFKNLTEMRSKLESDYTKIGSSWNFEAVVVNIMNARTPFGFTTGGHTGEDVLLAVYHPAGDVPMGMNTNVELNKYLCDVVGLQRPLDAVTSEIFVKHTEVFAGMECAIDTSGEFPMLTVIEGDNRLIVPAFSSTVTLNGEDLALNSVTVYIDKNETFYLPVCLRDKLKKI